MKVKNESFWTKNFILLFISNALLFLAFEMLMPTLPLFAEKLGGTPSQIGLIAGSFTITSMLIRVFASGFMQAMNKKYILLIGVLICMLATGSYMLSGTLLALLVFRLVHGAGFGIASTYYATLTSEQLPRNRLGEGMGYFGVGETICISVGPMIGIGMVSKFDFSGLFILGFVILLFAALMLLGITRKSSNEIILAKNECKRAPIKLLEKRVLPQCFLIFLIGIVVSGVMSYLSLFAKQQGITNIAWFFFIAAITGIFIRVKSGKIFDQKGPIYILIPSGLSLIIAMILIAFSQSELQLNLAAVFYGVAFGAIFPALQAWVIDVVEIESREVAVGSFFNFFDIGIGGGSLLLGLIIEVASYKVMYLFLILFVIVYLVSTVYIVKYKRGIPT